MTSVEHGRSPSPRPQRKAARLVAALYGTSTVAAVGLAIVYWNGGEPQWEGALLALSLGGIGAGMVVWAKQFLPGDEVTEDRGPLASSEEDVTEFAADFARGHESVARRPLLLALLAAAAASLAGALVFPVRSLGPRPGRGLFNTGFVPGIRLVTAEGVPVRPQAVPVGGVLTVWPEGHVEAADSPTLLVRVESPALFTDGVVRAWTVGGIVAYSKLCTHLGCPVGLYQAQEHLLLCPCHQSTFAVLDGARPVFGPAVRPLPQLPIAIGEGGYLVATADYQEAVGAGFWDRPGGPG